MLILYIIYKFNNVILILYDIIMIFKTILYYNILNE